MIGLFVALLFILVFSFVQGIVYLIHGTTPAKEAKKKMDKIKQSSFVRKFFANKQLTLKKMGAGVLLKDQMTVSQWYLYKGMMAGLFGMICFFITEGILKFEMAKPISVVVAILGWFFLDIILRAQNRSSNDEMMPDIMEMSRSVLYGKRGGQYIADALKDAVIVVENKRLKTALMRLRNDLDGGRSLNDCLDELEMSFSNGEISAFCTVIKSLQSTGQVDEALRTLENNIEREQVSVNKKRCLMLEHKTMMYVIFIAMDILAMILYCIIMKLLQLQIGF
ncbi:MAG: type II secretion system F family protein [Anaerostipes sp.]|nr:type II secretion system F family protein [Anaerostipes sp.]